MKARTVVFIGIAGAFLGAAAVLGAGSLFRATSRTEYCMSCHFHDEADAAWKKGPHCCNGSGTATDCVSCHLPEEGTLSHFLAKTRLGLKDLFSYWTKDKSEIDWAAKRTLEYAPKIVPNSSCVRCHVNLLPEGISDDGITAHLHYENNAEKLGLQCVSCHLDAGHVLPGYSHAKMTGVPQSSTADAGPVYEKAAAVTSFEDFLETIPGTRQSISMKAIPGGTFMMGSPESEYGRSENEGPRRSVSVRPFFMAEVEITWDQYWAFYSQTMSEGRTPPEVVRAHNSRPDIDAVSGPTPPFGNPDQGWGMGERPAITMTHYAAETFCKWLSMKTGKTYRLPTEAEWEYAARAGTDGPYFFEGNARRFSKRDTTVINTYVCYSANSASRTVLPSEVKPNPFGLRNMLGNVAEYCSDLYGEGPEHVVRGGLYSSPATQVRCSARDHTRNDDWLRTDPQLPKSIWWYSDVKGIGFRVVCELPDTIAQ